MIKIVIVEDDEVWIDLLKEELPEKIENCEVYLSLIHISEPTRPY